MGVAAFGAIFSNSLRGRLESLLPADAELPHLLGPQAVAHLPATLRDDYLHAFAASMHTVYLTAAGVALLAFAAVVVAEGSSAAQTLSIFGR